MRILYVTDQLPYPLVSGGRIRVYNLVKRVARRHDVWLAGFAFDEEEAAGITALEAFCRGVIAEPWHRVPLIAKLARQSKYLVRGVPFDYYYLESATLARRLRELTASIDFDVVHVLPSPMAIYLPSLLLKPSCRRILGFFDVNSVRFGRMADLPGSLYRRARNRTSSIMVRSWESRIVRAMDGCEAVSELDQTLLRKAHPGRSIELIPNGVDTRTYRPLSHRPGNPALLFVGKMDYFPCADAALYLAKDVFPLVQKVLPATELFIVGVNPPTNLLKLKSRSVHITGKVDDIAPYYEHSSICVVPLRAAGGTRLKILEAMAFGRPVVSTSLGCEGLHVEDEKHLLIANSPSTFAEQIFRLTTDRDLYDRVRATARQLVVSRYDWDIISEQLMKVYARFLQTRARDA